MNEKAFKSLDFLGLMALQPCYTVQFICNGTVLTKNKKGEGKKQLLVVVTESRSFCSCQRPQQLVCVAMHSSHMSDMC